MHCHGPQQLNPLLMFCNRNSFPENINQILPSFRHLFYILENFLLRLPLILDQLYAFTPFLIIVISANYIKCHSLNVHLYFSSASTRRSSGKSGSCSAR